MQGRVHIRAVLLLLTMVAVAAILLASLSLVQGSRALAGPVIALAETFD